jgi:hypothetical protein
MEKRALVKNASDRDQVKRAAWKEKDLRRNELDDLRQLLDLPAGRRFVWKWLEVAGVFRSSYTGDNNTFFNEGRRSIGLKMLADVTEAAPEAYLQMIEESRETEERLSPDAKDKKLEEETHV